MSGKGHSTPVSGPNTPGTTAFSYSREVTVSQPALPHGERPGHKGALCYKPLAKENTKEHKETLKPESTDHSADWGKRNQPIYSCVQILAGPSSKQMSLSARRDLNFPSSLAVEVQKGSPGDLII